MFLGRLPRKQKFQTHSGTLEYVLSGRGDATLVLFSGAGVTVEGWGRLYPTIESIGRVLACNRFGAGGSSKPALPQTGTVVIDAMRELLSHAGLRPPYLLVGHSLGGLYANLFARRHPAEVAGVVLIEAAHPKDRELLKGHEGQLAKVLGKVLAMPQQLFRANLHSEMDWIDALAAEVETAGGFPPAPLVVITGGNDPPRWLVPEQALRIKRAHQQELARLSPLGRQVIARRSGHFPQLTQPELVLDAIRTVVEQALAAPRAESGPARLQPQTAGAQ